MRLILVALLCLVSFFACRLTRKHACGDKLNRMELILCSGTYQNAMKIHPTLHQMSVEQESLYAHDPAGFKQMFYEEGRAKDYIAELDSAMSESIRTCSDTLCISAQINAVHKRYPKLRPWQAKTRPDLTIAGVFCFILKLIQSVYPKTQRSSNPRL